MKRILLASATVLIFGNIFAISVEEDAKRVLDAKRAQGGVPIYDVITLSQYLDQHMGEILAVMCNCRGKDIRHLKPNWYEGSIWQQDRQRKGKFAYVRVMIAKKDLEAFKTIPTVSSGGVTMLQGRVEHDTQANFSFLRLIYSNAPPDTTAHP